MKDKRIPIASAKRLSLYYRYLCILYEMGTTQISSVELSEALKVDSATIRRDFSSFGALGKRGYGYDVEELMRFFSQLLNQDRLTKVALVGVGNLGRALLQYNFKRTHNIQIDAGFDVQDSLIGTIQHDVPIYPPHELEAYIREHGIRVAILSVPAEAAQQTVDVLVHAGVKGILNFTPIRVSVPEDVRVQQVDLTNELQTLIYFITPDSDV